MTATKGETFVAVDGTFLAYRSHFAFIDRPLTTRDGEVTSAVYGFIMALRRIVEILKPDRLVVVFDPPGPTFRHEVYTQYKAQRERMPSDLRSQLPWIDQYLDAAGIPRLAIEGFEADDVLATLGLRAAAEGLRARIVSNDKDLLQVVGGSLEVVQLGRASEPPKVLDAGGVKAAFGVPPAKIVDLLALTGDSSDNVPGVPGVGPKTAVKLLEEHGTVEGVLDGAAAMKPGKVRDSLLASRDAVKLSRHLVTLRTDVDVGDLDEIRPRPMDGTALRELFERLDFQTLKKDVVPEPVRPDVTGYETVVDEPAVGALAARLRAAGAFAFGVVTASTGPLRADPVGFACCDAAGRAAFLPLGRALGTNVDRATFVRTVGGVLADAGLRKWGHDVKTAQVALARLGVEPRGVDFDTMLASYVLDSSRGGHDVDGLARDRLGLAVTPWEDVTGAGRTRVPVEQAPLAALARRAAEEVDAALRLRPMLEPEIDAGDPRGVLRDLELPLVDVLARMERAGVRIDTAFLGELSRRMEEELATITEKAWAAAGEPFNLASPKQVSELLFGKLQLRPRGRTKTGLSTSAAVLEELEDDHEVVRLVLRHRELSKLKSNYADTLPALVSPETGRVHTTFQQAVAATGRLSSVDPNLQNVPVRTWEGREIRKAFVPAEDGWVLVSCDYSQLELRLLAHMAKDEALLAAFREDIDVHRATAARIFDVPVADVTAEQRAQAKTVNYAVTYGMGAVNLGKSLGIPTKDASRFIKSYFERLPGVLAWIEETQRRAREELVVETLCGRRRPVKEIASHDPRTRSFGERIAINTPLQGSAADILKRAMIRADEALRAGKLRARMILTVHDELVFDCPSEERERVVALAVDAMEGAADLSVPLKVDSGWGANWSEAH
ncbi:MAG: DNA polymerase I [bacterium]